MKTADCHFAGYHSIRWSRRYSVIGHGIMFMQAVVTCLGLGMCCVYVPKRCISGRNGFQYPYMVIRENARLPAKLFTTGHYGNCPGDLHIGNQSLIAIPNCTFANTAKRQYPPLTIDWILFDSVFDFFISELLFILNKFEYLNYVVLTKLSYLFYVYRS